MKHRRLREEITIERLGAPTTSPAGTVTETWTPLATVRAELLQRSIRERLEAFGAAEESTLGFRLYSPGVQIMTGDRITWSGKALDIVDVVEVQRGRVMALEIICRQVTK